MRFSTAVFIEFSANVSFPFSCLLQVFADVQETPGKPKGIFAVSYTLVGGPFCCQL